MKGYAISANHINCLNLEVLYIYVIRNPNPFNQKRILLEMQVTVKVYKMELNVIDQKVLLLRNFNTNPIIYFDKITTKVKEISIK